MPHAPAKQRTGVQFVNWFDYPQTTPWPVGLSLPLLVAGCRRYPWPSSESSSPAVTEQRQVCRKLSIQSQQRRRYYPRHRRQGPAAPTLRSTAARSAGEISFSEHLCGVDAVRGTGWAGAVCHLAESTKLVSDAMFTIRACDDRLLQLH